MPLLTIDKAWIARFERDLMQLRDAAKDYSEQDRLKLAKAFSVFERRVFLIFDENFLGARGNTWVSAPVRDALLRTDEPVPAAAAFQSIALSQQPTLVIRHSLATVFEDQLYHPLRSLLSVLADASLILSASYMERPYRRQDLAHLLKLSEPEPWSIAEAFKDALLYVLDALNRRGNEFQIYVPTTKKITIDNVPVTVVGVDYGDTKDAIERFSIGLKQFKQRLERVAPRVLRIIDSANIHLYLGPASEKDQPLGLVETTGPSLYRGDSREPRLFVWFFPRSHRKNNPISYTIAHEIGHVVFHTLLGPKAVDAWTKTIKGDMVYLPVKTLVERWPHRNGNPVPFERLFSSLRESDPLLALQVAAFSEDGNLATFIRMFRDRMLDAQGKFSKEALSYEWFRRDLDLEDYKQIAILKVPGTPITGYANKNPEEAFCEAFAMLVTYGPRTLYPKVYLWLSTVLGADVRMGTAAGQTKRAHGRKVR